MRFFTQLLLAVLLLSASWSASALHPGYELFAETKSFRFYAESDPPKLFYTLAERAEQQLATIAKASGYVATKPTDVYITLDHDAFLALDNPYYAIGIARPYKNEIMLTLRDRNGKVVDLFAVFDHEVSHIALLRAAGNNADSLPRWFVEGFAEWQAKEHSTEQDAELLTAARQGNLLPLNRIDRDLPKEDTLIGLAYAQSAVLIRHLVQTKGEDAVNQIVARVAAGQPFEDAIFASLGENLSTIEQRFLQKLHGNASWMAAFMDMNWLWGVASLLFVLAYLKKRRAIREAIRTMKDEDPPFLPGELIFLSFAPMAFMPAAPNAARNDNQEVSEATPEQSSNVSECSCQQPDDKTCAQLVHGVESCQEPTQHNQHNKHLS